MVIQGQMSTTILTMINLNQMDLSVKVKKTENLLLGSGNLHPVTTEPR